MLSQGEDENEEEPQDYPEGDEAYEQDTDVVPEENNKGINSHFQESQVHRHNIAGNIIYLLCVNISHN